MWSEIQLRRDDGPIIVCNAASNCARLEINDFSQNRACIQELVAQLKTSCLALKDSSQAAQARHTFWSEPAGLCPRFHPRQVVRVAFNYRAPTTGPVFAEPLTLEVSTAILS